MHWMNSSRGAERGAVGVIVAMLFAVGGGSVILATTALVVDVGNLRAERRQLQNGADAASLSAAKQCSEGACPTATDLQALVNQNAADGATNITRLDGNAAVCGNAPLASPSVPPCPALSTDMKNLSDCPPNTLPTDANYVRVYTTTLTKDGSTILPYAFAQTLAGMPSGLTQQACASVRWGPGYPTDAIAAVTDASCAWAAATSNTPAFPDLPPYTPAPNASPTLGAVPVDAKYVVKVLLQGATGSSTGASCGKTTSGLYTAGNFGWLDVKAGTDCTADIKTVAGTMGGDTGASPSGNCGDYLGGKIGSIIYLPIFKSVTGTGSKAVYTLDGVSAFFLAGFQAPSAKTFSDAYDPYNVANPTPHCVAKTDPKLGETKDDGCLWGWFVSPKLPAGTFADGGSLRGPTIFSVAG